MSPPTRPSPTSLSAYEAKGLWFCSARRYIETELGLEAYSRLRGDLSPEVSRILHEALPSDWYPETALQQMLQGMHRVLSHGDDQRFVSLVTEISLVGVNRFFRLLLQLGTPAFTMRKVPILWKQLRRGPGRVSVQQDEPAISILRYTCFPFFADPIYSLLTHGTSRAAVYATCNRYPEVRFLERGNDWLTISVEHG